ncbi:hypothetical protein EWB00_001461 [Schistosoma japonicum]|uniref:Uncharacterized protein n=1 Tax=Schistosoma japonicum TaxID=6182 RepID=A0A4Z2CK40_SCHJA|nr:hypothetical protein EWB00_001461 [Schistosoma japonicum]
MQEEERRGDGDIEFSATYGSRSNLTVRVWGSLKGSAEVFGAEFLMGTANEGKNTFRRLCEEVKRRRTERVAPSSLWFFPPFIFIGQHCRLGLQDRPYFN